MADCSIPECDGDDQLAYTCNECEQSFCSQHRLPEAHNCQALRRTVSDGDEARFATGLQDKPGKKRGVTRRDDTTGSSPTSSASSSAKSSSESDEEEEELDEEDSKPYDTDRGWRSRAERGESGDLNSVINGSPSESQSESSDNHSTTPTTTATTTSSSTQQPSSYASAGRFTSWVSSLSTSISRRVRRLAAWLWHVLTGVLRLTGAALTLLGLGWVLAEALPSVLSGGIEQGAFVDVRALLVVAAGVVLVVVTKE